MIAEVGYAKASFSRIAQHAGLSSTGMISYHLAGQDDLLAACVAEIEKVTDAFMQSHRGRRGPVRSRSWPGRDRAWRL